MIDEKEREKKREEWEENGDIKDSRRKEEKEIK